MAAIKYDSDQARIIERIKAIAFREAMEAGATFITRKWIATKLKRSERWVTENWKKNPIDCFTEFHGGRPQSLSQESQQIVIASTGFQR
jgi:hypothetical protein